MGRSQMIVDSVVVLGRSTRATAQRFGVSKSWVAELVRRYREGGQSALEPRSTRPHANARTMADATRELVLRTRKELLERGADAGAETIHWHLQGQLAVVPSVSSIYRLLRREGWITPQPRKRPRASYVRFEASLPNECWQSDMTHWQLADASGVEILTFLDDYSRRVLACEAVVVAKAPDVRRLFRQASAVYGVPASVLSDNGAIYNATSRGGRTAFQSELFELGVLYKHSSPYHPQTCGKVERWHRTLKQFLAQRPATTMHELNAVLFDVVTYYNELRPHRSRGRLAPRSAYDARERLGPHTLINEPHYRLRTDIVDVRGHVSLRYLGQLRHLNVGWRYRGERVYLYIIDEEVEIVSQDGELIGNITLQADRDYHPITRSN